MTSAIEDEMRAGNADAPGVVLGSSMLGSEVLTDARVRLPPSMENRHGLGT